MKKHHVQQATTGDLLLQEIWRIKDQLSAARGHDVHRLFAETRKCEKLSGHPLVELQSGARCEKVASRPTGRRRPGVAVILRQHAAIQGFLRNNYFPMTSV